MTSALYQTNTLRWISIELAHLSNSPQIDILLHSDTLSWLWPNQSFLLLPNAACLAEKQYILIYSLLARHDQGLNPQSNTIEVSTLTIIPPMQFEWIVIILSGFYYFKLSYNEVALRILFGDFLAGSDYTQ